MKRAGYLFAFYLLFIAVIPCCLPGECHDLAETAAESQSDKKDCGSCSPFFHCEGCMAASISAEPALFELPALAPIVEHNSYYPASLPDAAYDFWQPPRSC